MREGGKGRAQKRCETGSMPVDAEEQQGGPESGSITHGHVCGLAPQMLVAKLGFGYT